MPTEKKKAPSKEKETTITGFVEETELESGETGIQLVADEYSYQVVMDKQGKKLTSYVDEEVEVIGVVTKSKDQRTIKVSRFQVLDDYEDDEEDDDDYDDDDDDDDEFFGDRLDD